MEHGRDKTIETASPPASPYESSPPEPRPSTPPPPPPGGDAPTWRPPPAPDHPREPGIQEGVPEDDPDTALEQAQEADRFEEPGGDVGDGTNRYGLDEGRDEPSRSFEVERDGPEVERDGPEVDRDGPEIGLDEPQVHGDEPGPEADEPTPYAIEPTESQSAYESDADPQPPYEISAEEPAEYAEPPAEYADPPAYAEQPNQSSDQPVQDQPPVRTSTPPNGAVQANGAIGLTPPSRRGGSGRFITDHIVELGFATAEQVDEAIEKGRTTGVAPEQALLNSGTINSDQLARATAERFGLDHLDLSLFEIDLGAVNLIPLHAAKRFEAVPVAFVDQGTVLVAMTDPTNVRAVDDIGIMTSMDVRPAVAAPEDIASVMARISKLDAAVAEAIEEGVEEAQETPTIEAAQAAETADAPVVKLVNGIIAQAVEEKASDVHFEPQGREIRVRYRVDGMLHDVTTIPRRMVAGVISRLKIMGNLDIAEKRLPQDGRITVIVEKHPIDIRVASLPAVNGEKIVLRLLDKEKALITLDQLGMQPETLAAFSRSFRNAYGATLVTGPTGSGKTTSLYAALNIINTPEKNIVTIEDPAEYQLSGITQIQVNTRTGLTFAAGLRSIVRSDPDVIMIGEIRDKETAQIAVESALTGHLVLSTMHTNDAPSAMTRLTEMGIEPFLSASAIDCVISQRLVRLLCSNCKERVLISAEQFNESQRRMDVNQFETHEANIEAYEARGCPRCSNTGYRGRQGIYEAMLVTDEIRSLVIERAPADAIRSVALRNGMRTLAQDGFEKVKQGMTTIEEVARVTGSAVSAD
jgi:type IV pilus assembly protein PilB